TRGQRIRRRAPAQAPNSPFPASQARFVMNPSPKRRAAGKICYHYGMKQPGRDSTHDSTHDARHDPEYEAAWRRIMTKPARIMNRIGMGETEQLQEVFDRGGDPNCTDRGGRPALTRAVVGRAVEAGVVRVLLEAGADPKIPGPDGMTPLERARRRLAKYDGKPRRAPRR